jgi:hypothetical protein
MATPWLKRIRKTGQLTVYNKATAWKVAVDAAISSFNNLSFGVQLVAEKEENAANIVLMLAQGPQQYKYYGDTAKTLPDFKADALHGQASTLTDVKKNEIFFAAVFLPGKVKKATDGQKLVIVVHELIHACGLNDQKKDHDSAGIMFAQMKEADGGLIEYLPEKGVKPMPPIRVGSQTLCKMALLWSGAEACKDS